VQGGAPRIPRKSQPFQFHPEKLTYGKKAKDSQKRKLMVKIQHIPKEAVKGDVRHFDEHPKLAMTNTPCSSGFPCQGKTLIVQVAQIVKNKRQRG
jgi:hypothetical protein